MKEITLPELYGANDKGMAFGLSEFLTDIVFTRTDLLQNLEFCEMVVALMPLFRTHRGAGQVGVKVRVSDEHQKMLLDTANLPEQRGPIPPEAALMIAHNRLAIKRAAAVTESAPA